MSKSKRSGLDGQPFNIRQHLDTLEPNPKEKNKYTCPVCGGNDLSINAITGAYTCFSNLCDSADIRNAIAPLSQGSYRSPSKAKPKTLRQTARDKARSVQLDSARVEAQVDELLLLMAEGVHTLEQAQVELSNWCKVEKFSAYDAGQLLKAKAKELGVGHGQGLSTADLVARLEDWERTEEPTEKWDKWEAIKRDSGKTHRDLMALVSARKVTPPPTDEEWAISAKAFGALDLGAREWLLERLLPANRSILVGADAKTGKSLLVYDWAYHLATGQSWGEFPCDRPRKVLIVQTDESEIDCQERLAARGLTELDNVLVIREFTPALMPRLKRVATNWGAEVVIFDSLTSIQRHSGYSPKDPEYGYFLYDLKEWAATARVTPIIVCHTNKASVDLGIDKIAGSYSITAAVSEILMLTRPADPADDCDRVLVRVGSRSSGQSAWLIGLNLEDYSWQYKFPCQRDGKPLEDDSSFTPDQKLNCRENIVKFLAHHNGKAFEAREIAETLGANYNNVRKICADLRSEGMILRRRVGKAWVYSCRLPVEPPAGAAPNDQVIHRSEPSIPCITGSEKTSQKPGAMDQHPPLTLTERGFQLDHLSDPLEADGSRSVAPAPHQDITDAELADLLGGDANG
jgi:archaellum biogenesis ATPase FlaH